MKFSYNWISELVDGLDVPAPELIEPDHDEDGRDAKASRSTAGACDRAARRALNPWSRSTAARTSKRLSMPGGAAESTVVCGAPNCRPVS